MMISSTDDRNMAKMVVYTEMKLCKQLGETHGSGRDHICVEMIE